MSYKYVYPTYFYSLKITHLQDFEYWRIFSGLTRDEIKKREGSCEYPPRLQIECKQITNLSKPLIFSFVVSKMNKDMKEIHIAQFQFSLIKTVTGIQFNVI